MHTPRRPAKRRPSCRASSRPKADGPRADAADRVSTSPHKGQARYLLGKLHPWKEDTELLLLTESRSAGALDPPQRGNRSRDSPFSTLLAPTTKTSSDSSREQLLEEAILPMMRYLVDTHLTGTTANQRRKIVGQPLAVCPLDPDARPGRLVDLGRPASGPARRRPPCDGPRSRSHCRHGPALPNQTGHQGRGKRLEQPDLLGGYVAHARRCPTTPCVARKPSRNGSSLPSCVRAMQSATRQSSTGKPWQNSSPGANIDDDYTLENHGFVHPDYMTGFQPLPRLRDRLSYVRPRVAGSHDLQRGRHLPEPEVVRPARWRIRLSQRTRLASLPQRRLDPHPIFSWPATPDDPGCMVARHAFPRSRRPHASPLVRRKHLLARRVLLRVNAQ